MAAAVLPGNDETATREPGNRWLILVVARMAIDLELGANRRTVLVVALGKDTEVVTPRFLVVRLPSDDKTAVFQRRNRRLALSTAGMRIDLELFAIPAAVRIKALAINTLA